MRGRVSVRIVDGVAEEYLASARKATDAEAVAQFEQACRALYDQWRGGLPPFLQELLGPAS